MKFDNIDFRCINSIRGLAIDAVEKAKSGHPGMPLGAAAMAYILWKHFLKFHPKKPDWLNRDRFILSAGHGSMLLYALLHCFGYALPMKEIKNFRQLGSLTPGHPESDLTAGVEVTTGPLGQGIANGVGLAIAEKYLVANFNKKGHKIIDHKVFVLAGDGCLQEGISHEACSLAGHLNLNNLILIHDNNHITIDGSTNISCSDDQLAYFRSKNWETIAVKGDGNDLNKIFTAFQKAVSSKTKPVFLSIESCIGYGSPNKVNSAKAHGSPLGKEELKATKQNLKLNEKLNFYVPPEAYARFKKIAEKGMKVEKAWQQKLAIYKKKHPEEYKILNNPINNKELTKLIASLKFTKNSLSTRAASGEILEQIMPKLPLVLGGSADLTGSNNTKFSSDIFYNKNYKGRYLHYGIREHAMGAIINGIASSKILKAYGGTFLCFSDYMRPAIRLAALANYPSIFILSHDSIGLGEDGPTHQPVEHLAALRAIPNLFVFRPADANETKQAWHKALTSDKPTAIILSRQNLPIYPEKTACINGAYIVSDSPKAKLILIASGSELQLAVAASQELKKHNIASRVVSIPCWELFEEQSLAYKEKILPTKIKKRIAIEAGIKQGWERYLGDDGVFIGMDSFGASAPAEQLFKHNNITVEKIIETAKLNFGFKISKISSS